MKGFPTTFCQHHRFAELRALVSAINSHEAMRMETSHCRNNITQASLAFTVCFYANLLVAIQGELKRLHGRSPFAVTRRTDLLHLLLALCKEELATNNIKTLQGGMSPHFVPMIEAAEAAGVRTAGVEQLILLLSQGISMSEACDRAGFRDSLKQYFLLSEWCTQDWMRSFATIALRELTLADNFQVIADHLPGESCWEKYRLFLTGHICLDAGERADDEVNHGQLMSEALEGVEDVGGMLDVMIRFYKVRLLVYEDCLQPQSLW